MLLMKTSSRYLADLTEYQLQELAYTLFSAYCGPQATSSLRIFVRQQLEVYHNIHNHNHAAAYLPVMTC